MAKRKPEEVKPGAPAWQSTFADLMNLLLCFFVLLFSMSTVDAQKFELIAASFSQTFSIFNSGGSSLTEGLLINNGVSDAIVQTQLRHSDIATTRRFYYFDNSNEESKADIIEKAIGQY